MSECPTEKRCVNVNFIKLFIAYTHRFITGHSDIILFITANTVLVVILLYRERIFLVVIELD